MQFTRIQSDPDVFEIVVPFTNISTSATNCYVVMDEGDALVVDTGAPTEEGIALLIAALDELGVDRGEASYFLTHFHLDHAGLANQVIPNGAKLYAGKTEFATTRPEMVAEHAEALCARMVALGASADEAKAWQRILQDDSDYIGPNHNLQLVEEGDAIPVGRYMLEVVDTSGHTAGHVSLFEPASGLFIGGDHMLFVISPSIDSFSSGDDSMRAYLDNLRKLLTLPIKTFLPAHGDIRPDFRERIEWLGEHHRKRLEETYELVRRSSGIRGIDLVKSLRWNVPFDRWEDISLIQRAIIIVQGLVLIKHLCDSGKIEEYEDAEGTACFRIR